jgi:hypothetical protein
MSAANLIVSRSPAPSIPIMHTDGIGDNPKKGKDLSR